MNYVSLDPIGHGYVGNHNGAANWSRHGVVLWFTSDLITEVENCGEKGKNLIDKVF